MLSVNRQVAVADKFNLAIGGEHTFIGATQDGARS